MEKEGKKILFVVGERRERERERMASQMGCECKLTEKGRGITDGWEQNFHACCYAVLRAIVCFSYAQMVVMLYQLHFIKIFHFKL